MWETHQLICFVQVGFGVIPSVRLGKKSIFARMFILLHITGSSSELAASSYSCNGIFLIAGLTKCEVTVDIPIVVDNSPLPGSWRVIPKQFSPGTWQLHHSSM